MAMRLRRVAGWSTLGASVALAGAIWVMLMVLATRPGLKTLVDLSPQARFTVEDDTKVLLAGLREKGLKLELHTVFEPLMLHENASERDQHIHQIRSSLQTLTIDLLRQYGYLGGDAVTVRHHDLRRDLEQVRQLMRAVQAGRSNFVLVKLGERSKVLSIDYDLAEIEVPGSGPGPQLPGQGRDAKPILRSFKGEEAISSAIKSLLVEGTPTLYVLDGYRTASIQDATAFSYSHLMSSLEQEGFKILRLNLAEARAIPADATALALIEPRSEIPETDAELLLAYLRRGGRLFLNVAYVDQPSDWNPTLGTLGQRLGFALGQDLVCNLIPDPNNPKAPPRHGEHLVQNLTIVDLNPVHPITAAIARAGRYPVVKAAREFIRLEKGVPEDIAVDPSLLRTSRAAWIEERTVANGAGDRSVDFYAPNDGKAFAPRCVGAVIDIVAREGDRPGHAVVITGNTFVNAMMSENGDLALNIFQWMAERAALVTVRGERYKPNSLRIAPQQVSRMRWLLILGVPGGMLLLGLVVLWRRSRI